MNLQNLLLLEKSYQEGVYGDTPQNRKLGRVGMKYNQERENKEKDFKIRDINGEHEVIDLKNSKLIIPNLPYDKKQVKELNKWLKDNKDRYIRLYHGTHKDNKINEEGLLRTNNKRKKSLQSQTGYVYLSLYPSSARSFGEMGYGKGKDDINVYAVDIKISDLLPDKDQLKNKKMWGGEDLKDLGDTLADSLLFGNGGRVKRDIKPWELSKTFY